MSPARFTSVIRHTREEPQSPALRRAAADDVRARWREVLRTVRAETERRAALLSAEDQQVQSMPDASPTKWHRAHVTWFFEQFLLVPHLQGYQVFDARFPFLFNSYYVGAGPRHARAQRGLITRPDCSEVAAFRAHVDVALERLVAEADESKLPEVLRILEIGIHHEQQHQELILTDLLHAFARNPVAHACDASWRAPVYSQSGQFVDLPSGVHPIGFAGEGYCLDNEQPAHEVYVQPARIARALVSNGQWLEFMTEGGYTTPSLWLSDGWAIVEAEGWTAPGYWREHHGAWHALTLGGLAPIDPNAPVMHVSYYEADAFARWAGKHLPTESEWEVAARYDLIDDAFGVAWQWTRSAYLPYPGYRAADGVLAEYNGKFMINQMVLRGSSLATPAGHSRASYRNFFHPPARWQFSGLRLVDYVDERTLGRAMRTKWSP
jgi:ergothioneine biosynthesis protein EgtB